VELSVWNGGEFFGEHQWRPARADKFENIGNDLTIGPGVGHKGGVSVVNR
jgi:hypothetical protein